MAWTAARILRGILPTPRALRLSSQDAYRLWSTSYDDQPDNVVLRMEGTLFANLLGQVPIEGASVLDVGCGTGRHWGELMARRPRSVEGADNSAEMLQKLRTKFPSATLHLLDGHDLGSVSDAEMDVVISTLTIGHIRQLPQAIQEWARVTRPGGRGIITDFHPEAFRQGLTRTFTHQGRAFEAENHLHAVADLRALFSHAGFDVLSDHETVIDKSVKGLFERQNRIADYERLLGTPIIAGFLLERR